MKGQRTSRGRVIALIALAWGIPGVAWVGDGLAATDGLDYWPDRNNSTSFDQVLSGGLPLDAIKYAGDIWIFHKISGDIKVAKYNTDAGTLSGTSGVLIAPESDTNSYDSDGIASANVELCAGQQSGWQDLTNISGSNWEAPDIGIAPPTIVVRKKPTDTGTCGSLDVDTTTFTDGYNDDVIFVYDRFDLTNEGTCTTFQARYTYTNCSLTGDDRFWCEMDVDPVSDSDEEYGYCKFFMMYEGEATLSGKENKFLFLARAQEPDSVWRKAMAGTYPVSTDVKVQNSGQHSSGESAGDRSFAGVPDFVFDDGVWRMWFVSEDAGAPIRYTESDDDGITWGFGGNAAATIDCYDTTASAFDTGVCKAIAWGTEPPDDSSTYPDPDGIDPGFLVVDIDTDAALETLMFTAGADDGCAGAGEGTNLVILASSHDDLGDQGASDWTWIDNVEVDNSDGVLVDEDGSTCNNSTDRVYDPTPVKYATDQYIMFFGMDGHMYVAGSGFQCSNFVDDDSDSKTDFGGGTGEELAADCASPTDDSE